MLHPYTSLPSHLAVIPPRACSIIASSDDTQTLFSKTDDADDDLLQPFPIDGFVTMVMPIDKISSL